MYVYDIMTHIVADKNCFDILHMKSIPGGASWFHTWPSLLLIEK